MTLLKWNKRRFQGHLNKEETYKTILSGHFGGPGL